MLQWRHNGHDGVSNHQAHDCLLNRLFRRRSKKTPKFRVTGLYAGNSPVTRKVFPLDDVIMVSWCRTNNKNTKFPNYWTFVWTSPHKENEEMRKELAFYEIVIWLERMAIFLSLCHDMTPAIQRAVDWRDQRSTHGKENKMANNLQETFSSSHMIHLPIFFRVTPRASLSDMGEIGWYQGAVQYIGYPSKTQLKPISRKISFAHHLFLSYLIALKFCTEHGSFTAVLCPKFQNDLATKTNLMDERDFARV